MEKFNFKNRIQSNPRLLRLKNPTTGEIIDYEIQDLQESEIVENGTEMTAEVLNTMQSNIEESCVAVNPTQPETNERVWIQKGKNLVKNYFLHKSVNGDGEYKDDYCIATDFIIINPKTNYVCSNSMNITAGGVFIFDENKNFLEKINADKVLSVINTTNENAKYARIVLWNPNIDNLEWIQLEQGSTATEYEAYVEQKIWCKNDNGVFEEFYNAKYINELNGTILYRDNGITSITEDMTVTLFDDLSNYKYYEVWASRFANASGWITTGKIPVGNGSFLSSAESSDGIYYRDIQCPSSGNQITFQKNKDGHEQRCIPRIIKGYKF